MAETTTGVRAMLSHPVVYELWSQLVGARRARNILVSDYVRPGPGDRVLDLGCGPGELLPHLGDATYVGVDFSGEYIRRARTRFGNRAQLRVGDVTALEPDLEGFDLVIAFGVVHHLDDDGARALFAGAARALKPAGRCVTVDPTFVDGQRRAALAIIARDRGQHVRTPAQYVKLAAADFPSVAGAVRHDLLRMPYSHCVLDCGSPAR